MNLPFLRYTLLAILLGAACAWLSPETAHAQGTEKAWRCPKCGQHLGLSVERPTYCQNCSATPKGASKDSGDGKLSMGFIVAAGFFLLIGAGAYIMRDSSRP